MTRDRGSAAIWVLGCGVVLLTFGLVVTVRALAVLGRHRAESAADLAALAAATQIGTGGDPCAAARRIAAANHATTTQCLVRLDATGRSGTVRVRVSARVELPVVGAQSVSASARAGRLAVAAPVPDTLAPGARPSRLQPHRFGHSGLARSPPIRADGRPG